MRDLKGDADKQGRGACPGKGLHAQSLLGQMCLEVSQDLPWVGKEGAKAAVHLRARGVLLGPQGLGNAN